MCENFDEIFICGLPTSIKSLGIDWAFLRPIKRGFFSKNITELTIFNKRSRNFEYKISKEDFPQNLTHLTFYGDFNHPIGAGVLPQNLTHLTMYWDRFNQPIGVGVLPPNLKHLELGTGYQHIFREGELPQTLENLILAN